LTLTDDDVDYFSFSWFYQNMHMSLYLAAQNKVLGAGDFVVIFFCDDEIVQRFVEI